MANGNDETNGATVSKATVNGHTIFIKAPVKPPAVEQKMSKKIVEEDADGWLRLANGKYLEHDTNIKEIEVPDFLRERITTKVEWIDRTFGGKEKPGFTPSMCTMLTAVPGGGKTTLALQICDALYKQGCIPLYNTGEESPEQVAMTRERLGLLNGFIIGADHMLNKFLGHADVLRKKYPQRPLVLVVDSIKTLNDGKYSGTNSVTPVRVTRALVNYAKEHKAIVIQVGHVNKRGEYEGKTEVKHLVDAHAHIRFDLNKNSPTFGKRIFAFQKNRFGPICAEGEILKMTNVGLVSEGCQDDYDLE